MTQPNTSPRFFFTNPLAAAWMALHHDFDYDQTIIYSTGTEIASNDEGKEIGRKCVGLLEWPWEDGPRRFYLRDDCFDLLEPRVGDLGINAMGFTVTFHHGDWHWGTHVMPKNHGSVKIIQRNGIAFHSPEREP
jgi:hypothetical protein